MEKVSCMVSWLKEVLTLLLFIGLVILLILVFAYPIQLLGNLVPEQRAVDALTDAGYTEVTIIERHTHFVGLQGCGSDDWVAFDARATNPANERVDVLVCTGLWFKGTTIRFK